MVDLEQKLEGRVAEPLPHKDWFLPAIEHDGTVRKSFDAVLRELKQRGDFIVQLRERLTRHGEDLDRLSSMRREAKELENTLRFRLGILQPERPAAWFRKAVNKNYGPFRSTMLMAPVLCNYDTQDVDEIVISLKRCWEQAKTGPVPYTETCESLWGILLGHHAELETMAVLNGAFAGIRLDRTCADLPACVESPSLRAFLVNVCGEFVAVRDRLHLCFDHLWSASEKLWAYQRQSNRLSQRQRAQSNGASQQRHQSHRPGAAPPRELGVSFAEMDALRYMGFRQRPHGDDLKRRYFEMAKQLHPDREGGSEESFKMLNKAYNLLKSPSISL